MIPKPTSEGRLAEVNFYEKFFASVAIWLPFDVAHLQRALMKPAIQA